MCPSTGSGRPGGRAGSVVAWRFVALASTLHRFDLAVSDVDRGVYESLDLRVARHPSESVPYMLARVLAYGLSWEQGIELGPGLGEADEPAVRVRDPYGNVTKWIDVGTPSAERMHRASKAVSRVAVFTHHDPELLRREASRSRIHRVERIEVFSLDPRFLDALGAHVERHTKVEVTATEGQLYVKAGGQTLETTLERLSLA